ncbi:SpoIIE family protein phosphatase [Streptomyces sp. NPDC000983]|uniref:SpoIIE family protein phosphatase n=1 Tax=Streptomyces sp. NPDC000983 TaxID=3154373 RepID=UPI003322A0D9
MISSPTPASGPASAPHLAAGGTGAVWNGAPCPILVLDRDGGIVELNDAARRLLAGPDGAPWPGESPAPGEGLVPGEAPWSGESSVSGEGPWPGESRGPGQVPGPAWTAPEWLAAAHLRLRRPGAEVRPAHPVAGAVADRTFKAHPTPRPDGAVMWWLMEDTDLRLAERALEGARARSEVLTEISSALLSSLNVERCLEVTARMAADHLADAAVVVAPAHGRRYPLTYAQKGGPVSGTALEVDPDVVPGLTEALQGFPPVPARWISPDAIPDWAVPPGFEGSLGSVIVTPLPGHGFPAGALILLRSGSHRAFDEGEEVFARLFSARAGAALSAARLYTEQSAITSALMRELLPPTLRHVHGVGYAGRYRASHDHERVGGDFYDVHPGSDPAQESFAVLGDVSGKGLEAAVLTGKIRSVLQALLPLSGDHQKVLGLLNDALLNSHSARFATLTLASARHRAGLVHLRLTSAGHLPPLIVRRDGSVEEADTRGQLIGAIPDVSAHTARLALAPGETCLLYTDGITEARGGPLGDEMYGERRLRSALRDCARMPPEAVVERVHMLADQWLGGRHHDDMASLAITNPAGSRGPLTLVAGRTTRPGTAGDGSRESEA